MKLIQKKYAVFIDNQNENWIENLKIGIKPLLDDEAIDEKWIDKLIKSTDEFGPYWVFSDKLAMPHISPDSSTKKTTTGFIFCKTPLVFSGNNKKNSCKIIIPLISTDGTSHLELLSQIVTKWNDQSFINKLDKIHDLKSFNAFIEETENEC